MDSQYGIVIYQPQGNGPSKIIFSTQYPFAKLDTQNPVSFQNISLTFENDPPNPISGNAPVNTTVYTFKHGYDFIPTIWMMWQRSIGSSTQDGSEPDRYPSYVYEEGVIAANSSSDAANVAWLLIEADETNVYIQVLKSYASNFGSPVNLVGYELTIRVYCFVEPMYPTT